MNDEKRGALTAQDFFNYFEKHKEMRPPEDRVILKLSDIESLYKQALRIGAERMLNICIKDLPFGDEDVASMIADNWQAWEKQSEKPD